MVIICIWKWNSSFLLLISYLGAKHLKHEHYNGSDFFIFFYFNFIRIILECPPSYTPHTPYPPSPFQCVCDCYFHVWACEEDTWYPTMSVFVPSSRAVHFARLSFWNKNTHTQKREDNSRCKGGLDRVTEIIFSDWTSPPKIKRKHLQKEMQFKGTISSLCAIGNW